MRRLPVFTHVHNSRNFPPIYLMGMLYRNNLPNYLFLELYGKFQSISC
jgi:hypothetical protein